MSEVVKFKGNGVRDFPKHQELYTRMVSLVYEYEQEISTAAAIGIIDLVKDEVKGFVSE